MRKSMFAVLMLVVSCSSILADQTEQSAAVFEKFLNALIATNEVALKDATTPVFYDALGAEAVKAGPVRPTAAELGSVRSVEITSSKQFDAFRVFSATVVHSTGLRTYWQFRLDQSERRVAAATLMKLGSPNTGLVFISRPARLEGREILLDRLPGLPGGLLGSSEDNKNRNREVEFFFATDRRSNNKIPLEFVGYREPQLGFGAVSVRIPEDHRFGRIELPANWRLFGYEIYREKRSDAKHFSVKRLGTMSEADWSALIKEQNPSTALVFVHGFNTSFEDAVYRNAQILWDMQYHGLSILYSWSSKGGGASDYGFDRESALVARDNFIRLITKLQNELGIERINVIAHSMGNMLVVDALKSNAATAKPVKLEQLIMAAPDVDRAVFALAVPELHKLAKGLTLYVSSADKALRLSSTLAKFPRAGDVPNHGPLSLPDVDTIDVTAVGNELFGLNHTEFAQNRSVMDDMRLLIDEGRRPPRLAQIRQVPEYPEPVSFWRYVK